MWWYHVTYSTVKSALLKLYSNVIKAPSFNKVAENIRDNLKRYLYFINYISVINSTYLFINVLKEQQA